MCRSFFILTYHTFWRKAPSFHYSKLDLACNYVKGDDHSDKRLIIHYATIKICNVSLKCINFHEICLCTLRSFTHSESIWLARQDELRVFVNVRARARIPMIHLPLALSQGYKAIRNESFLLFSTQCSSSQVVVIHCQ